MAVLKTNFKDDILDTSVNTRRKYYMYENPDGTVEFEDATEYSQVGDEYGAGQINATNAEVNNKFDKNMLVRDMATINAITEEGYAPDALALKEGLNAVNESLQNVFTGETVLLSDAYQSGNIALNDSLSNYKFIYCETGWNNDVSTYDSITVPISIFKSGLNYYVDAFSASGNWNKDNRCYIKYIDDTTILLQNDIATYLRPKIYGIK